MNFRSRLRAESPGFQLAPMIDVVFLLLCFFVTSQIFSQWEAEIGITLPTAETGRMPRRLPGEIVLNLDARGEVTVHNRRLDAGALDALLARLAEMFPGQQVVLRADRATAYEHVVRVLDACRRADIGHIAFATASPGPAGALKPEPEE